MSANEFDCLSNTLLQAGLRCELPVAFTVPARMRELVQGTDARDVCAVTLHQCPHRGDDVIDYELEVFFRDGSRRSDEFQASGIEIAHDTFVLYDHQRDGRMKHIHLLH
jgi:hypothetical protein